MLEWGCAARAKGELEMNNMQCFILVSRCAGEARSAYQTRFNLAIEEYESRNPKYQEERIADGVLLSAPNQKAYLSFRDL